MWSVYIMNQLKERLHKLDTAEISDALDSYGISGALFGIKAAISGKKCIGKAFTVQYIPYDEKPSEFKNAGNYIDDVPPGSVIVVDNQGREDCTVWGDILTNYAVQHKIEGTVIHGAARDIKIIRELNYPLFSRNIFMCSGKNRVKKIAHQIDIEISGIKIHPNDIVFGDDNGVVIIPQEYAEKVIDRAENIKSTEEKILDAVKKGDGLFNARKKFHYDQPWLKS